MIAATLEFIDHSKYGECLVKVAKFGLGVLCKHKLGVNPFEPKARMVSPTMNVSGISRTPWDPIRPGKSKSRRNRP